MTAQNTLFGPEAITLSAFNQRIASVVNSTPSLQRQWVIAETSDVRVARGHCYLELVEKDDAGNTVARMGAVIWASVYQRIAGEFKAVTGQDFATGMKVMVCMTFNFHPQYGNKAVISAINPEFTMGDMARKRKEIIDALTREGVVDNNKALPLTAVPQRIAVISAAGAAGYGDFINQLNANAYGLKFYSVLYEAAMQGANTVPSVLDALDNVEHNARHFDCVVIIRGGGASSELNSFDDLTLARRVATFPLKVVVGIGHERDTTVLDYVAGVRVKTPTAAAEFLIGRGADALAHLEQLRNDIVSLVRDTLSLEREHLSRYASLIPATAQRITDTARLRLDGYMLAIPQAVATHVNAQNTRLDHITQLVTTTASQALLTAHMQLQALNDKVTLLSPRNILNRGYSLTTMGGKFVTSATQLNAGDVITTHFKDGAALTRVGTIKLNNK